MKTWALTVCVMLTVALLLSAGCGGGNEPDDRREVEKPARSHGVFPIEATDEALRTEADVAMATINRQLQLKLATASNRDALLQDVAGPLNERSLSALGLTAGSLSGTWYQASDYHLAFSGGEVVITAGQPGSRGYKQARYPLR